MLQLQRKQPVADQAQPDCGVCRRSLLVGERVRVYRDRASRSVKVCELCRDHALSRGYEATEAVDSPRLRVQPSGSLSDMVDRDALIEGLGKELDYLREQLGAAHHELDERTMQEEGTVRAITDKLRQQEVELDHLRTELDPVRRAEEQRTLLRQSAELKDLREQLRRRDRQVELLQQAREAETDPRRMCLYALDAFNASEPAERMARIARTLDDPQVTVHDMGPGIPRHVHVTLVWEIAWYDFLVKLDLGAGKASVHACGNGGDPGRLPAEKRAFNARWRESGLVLA